MITKKQLKFIKSLQQKKFRQKHQAFVVEGEKITLEALHSSYQVLSVYASESFFLEHQASLGSLNAEIIPTSAEELARAGRLESNASALAVLGIPPPQVLLPEMGEFVLALDGLQDPGNLGTIIRIADWYGINKIVASPDTVDFYNPKTIAATMGSFLRVQVHYTDLKEYWSHQAPSQPIYGTFTDGINLHRQAFSTEGGFVVMGNESKGIRPEIHPYIQHRISIPRYGEAESLNVAMATAIVCDNLRRALSA